MRKKSWAKIREREGPFVKFGGEGTLKSQIYSIIRMEVKLEWKVD